MSKDNVITFVVQYEQFFELPVDDVSIVDAIRHSLEEMRGSAGARVVGSYSFNGYASENTEFWDKAVHAITLPIPLLTTEIAVD